MKRAAILVIGGFDPSGGAGVLADAEAVWKAGGRPLGVVTAWTVQTHRAVSTWQAVRTSLILAQLDALFRDESPRAVKLGMLGSAALAGALAGFLGRRLRGQPLVIDPVLWASSGGALFRGNKAAYHGLFKLATVITPNLPEAAALLDWKANVAWDHATMTSAGKALQALDIRAVVLKGGHLGGKRSDDLLLEGRRARWFAARRLDRSARGTGCRFASALAARLGRGEPLPVAVRHAKALVRRSLLAARPSA